NALCGGETADAGMGSVVIILVEPIGVGSCSVFVAAVRLGVGPFLGQGAVEAFDFAVGLRVVGPGVAMLDRFAEGVVEESGPVARSVVSHHRGHGDASLLEEGVGSLPETGGSFFALIGQDLGIGQPGVVIDGVMQKGVT